jgi:hypothetical protein
MVAGSSQFLKLIAIGLGKVGFLFEQRVGNVSTLQPEAIISRTGPTDTILAVQYYVSRSADEETEIGHRSNYPARGLAGDAT